jgi:hypothetical protein
MQWQEHKKCSSPSLPNSTKATKAYGGIREEEQKEGKQQMNPQDLDPICSPHLEERLIGGNVDLDLLSLFPQEYARIIGGRGRNGKLFKGNNGGERESVKRCQKDVEEIGRKEEEALLLNLPSKSCRWGHFPAGPVVPVPQRYNRWS